MTQPELCGDRWFFPIESSSECPLCRFLEAALHWGEVSAKVQRAFSFYFTLGWVGTPQPPEVFLLKLSDGQDRADDRFLLRLSNDEREQWPCSLPLRRHLLRERLGRYSLPYQHPQRSSINMGMLVAWLKGCREEHVENCVKSDTEPRSALRASPGFKSIDCTSLSVVKAPEVFQYVALSYVWGQPLARDVDSTDLLAQAEDHLPLDIPRTIKDAIAITLRLGFRYVWVDKYRINQSPLLNELHDKLALMDLIYGGAAITLIAAAGEDLNYGLPGLGDRPRIASSSTTINGDTWVSGCRNVRNSVHSSTWAKRGWLSSFRTSPMLNDTDCHPVS